MNAPDRRIVHLDMDAFYASVELLLRAATEPRKQCLGDLQRPDRVELQLPCDVLVADFSQRIVPEHAGIVDEDVQRTLTQRLDEARARIGAGDVHILRDLHSERLQFAGWRAACGNDIAAAFEVDPAQFEADPARGAGYEDSGRDRCLLTFE